MGIFPLRFRRHGTDDGFRLAAVVSASSILAPPYCKRSRSEGGYKSWKSLREIKYNPREITGPLTCLYTAVGMEAGVGSAYVRPSKMPATRTSRLALPEVANALI